MADCVVRHVGADTAERPEMRRQDRGQYLEELVPLAAVAV
jgi:hypothetical protein